MSAPTHWRDGDEWRAAVPGGSLALTRWGDGEETPVLAVHGITANGHSFARTALALKARGGPDLVAPDLRGRGESRSHPGPFGLAAHTEDTVAVLDDLGVERTVLVGHSMGAFVACLAAVRHPDRVAGVLLVDGGVGLPVPAGTDVQDVIGPAMERLRTTFADEDAYRDFWRVHPAFEGRWNTWTDHYVLRDLVGASPHMRSACAEAAVRVDGAQVIDDEEALTAVHRLESPARLMWSARGLMDESPGLYTPERLSGLPRTVRTVAMPDDNHYSPLFGPSSVLVAEQIHTLVEETVQVQGEL